MVIVRPSIRAGCSMVPYQTHLLGQPVEEAPPNLWVSHLAAPEADGELDFVSPVKKFLALAALCIQIVSGNLGLQPNLFQFNGVLISENSRSF